MPEDEISIMKRNSLSLFCSPERYDSYRRVVALSPYQYSHDLHFYNDTVS